MKKIIAKQSVAAFCIITLLAACGDDSSSTDANGGEPQTDISSSSVCSANYDCGDSSINSQTSSSSNTNNKEKSSSSAKRSLEDLLGPCEDKGIYDGYQGCDNEGNVYTCYRGEWHEGILEIEGPEWNQDNPGESSSSVEESSSSCEGCIDWSIPKEAYLNPEIEYESITDERDGKVYKTVKIGKQVWMAENLNYSDSVKTPSLLGKSWCYGNDPKKCEVAGRLYTWAAAIDSVALSAEGLDCGLHKVCELPEKVQGICPQGWHVPSLEEWITMRSEIGGESYAGTCLKSQRWDGDEVNPNFDCFGFSAIPAGEFCKTRMHGDTERDNSGEFNAADERVAFFWFASEETKLYAYFLHLFDKTYTLFNSGSKDNAYSIRCIKD
ncbi:MAG: fibrobacter succinogenes major paralogous domain-containing protein [Fibrobacter sp.]|nr:fibrobacter succinogenes major paralogous domain-containing protein [Fibrobacter sp.]